uniref:Uncharacterized protein n=1 Tax=Arundo donax TaxID=35708 RepID=A0A0A9EC63_ARUDO
MLYDPWHREPSYWYCLLNLIFLVHGSFRLFIYSRFC